MTEGRLAALTIRQVRDERALAPGGARFEEVIWALGPLVRGCGLRLVPEDPTAAGRIADAVFAAFARGWRRLPKRTVIAVWMLRSACFAGRKERRRLKLARLSEEQSQREHQQLLADLCRLRMPALNALVLRLLLQIPSEVAGQSLRIHPGFVETDLERGRKSLAVRFKKRSKNDGVALLSGMCQLPGAQMEAEGVELIAAMCANKVPKSALASGIFWGWRWMAWRRRLKWCGVTLGLLVGLLVTLGFTANWLMKKGLLMGWIIEHSQRQMVKDAPEIKQLARPWAPEGASGKLPESAGELYGLTNIWPVTLSFTAEEWKKIKPKRVQPVDMRGPNGGIVLRNPNASRNGLAGALGYDFNWVQGQLEFGPATFTNVAVRIRGNGTYVNSLFGPKQSFKVDLNRLTKGQSLAGLDELNFLNSIADGSYVRDSLAQEMFRALGVPGPRTAYAYLTLNVPGPFEDQPLGLYVMMENIDGDFAKDRFGSKKTPIFKPVTYDLFKDLGDDWKAYEGIYDLKTEATELQKKRVIEFARLVTHGDDAEFERRMEEYLDVREFAAFVAGHVLLSSYDGFLTNGQNYYMYLDSRSNRFGFISWDQDHSWGEFGYIGQAETREKASIWDPAAYEHRFLQRVMKVEAFRAVYREHLENALREQFTIEKLYPRIDQIAAMVRPAVAAEADYRLRRFDISVSTNWVEGPRDGAAEGPRAPVHQIKRFIANRIQSVRGQLDGREEGALLRRPPGRRRD